VKFNWKMLRLAAAAVMVAAGVGCGGLNGSYNVTPATFFLPGIGQVTTNAPATHIVALAPSEAVR
jgi:hypothetical protein